VQVVRAAARAGRLLLAAVIGQHDQARDWPIDAVMLRTLQGGLARRLGLEAGGLVMVSGSARLGASDEEQAREALRAHYPRLLAWQSDPRGLFRIRLEGEQIAIEHRVENLGPTGRRFSGTSAERLYKALVNDRLVLLPEHAAYLGSELQKAELALRLGLGYRQDEPLDLGGAHGPT
jgi:thymidylate synthase